MEKFHTGTQNHILCERTHTLSVSAPFTREGPWSLQSYIKPLKLHISAYYRMFYESIKMWPFPVKRLLLKNEAVKNYFRYNSKLAETAAHLTCEVGSTAEMDC